MNKVVWGKVADPDPRVISLLRTLRARMSVPAVEVEQAYKDLDAILQQWIDTESLSDLCAALGVDGKHGGRRKQSTVNREHDIVIAMINAAMAGKDVRSSGKAAAALVDVGLVADEKAIERAWKEWSSVQMASLRAAAEKPDWTAEINAAIERLPPVRTTNPDNE